MSGTGHHSASVVIGLVRAHRAKGGVACGQARPEAPEISPVPQLACKILGELGEMYIRSPGPLSSRRNHIRKPAASGCTLSKGTSEAPPRREAFSSNNLSWSSAMDQRTGTILPRTPLRSRPNGGQRRQRWGSKRCDQASEAGPPLHRDAVKEHPITTLTVVVRSCVRDRRVVGAAAAEQDQLTWIP